MAFGITNNKTMQQSRESNKIDIIEKTTKIVGDITSQADFRIDGKVEGTISTSGKVVIGNTGLVEGSLNCNNADVEGQIKGKLVVSEILSLRASAHVDGDVQTGKLAVEPGATFNANCQMKDAVKALKTTLNPTLETVAKSEQTA
jgi:cytoskeletal protein CcmA (bactofilin family)